MGMPGEDWAGGVFGALTPVTMMRAKLASAFPVQTVNAFPSA